MENRLVAIVGEVRKSPEAYLGRYSLYRMKWFLNGYSIALMDQGPPFVDCELQGTLQELVQSRYNVTSNHSWDVILRAVAGGDKEALDLFWKLWDECVEAWEEGKPDKFAPHWSF